MYAILGQKLAELAIALGILSQALAAMPAEYEILPLTPIVATTSVEFVLPVLSENPSQAEIRGYISASARKSGVSEFMALFIAENESHFRQYVVGDSHLTCEKTGKPIRSRGVWQINDCAWSEIGDSVAFNIEKSTKWAMEKLKEKPSIWSTYGDLLKTGQFEE